MVAYNRIVAAVRHLFREVRDHPQFAAMGLLPLRGKGFEMRSTAYSRALSQAEEAFQVSALGLSARHPHWPLGAGAFALVRFRADQPPELAAGAYRIDWGEDATYWFAQAHPVKPEQVANHRLRAAEDQLPCLCGVKNQGVAFRYASRRWQSAGAADVTWILSRLADAGRGVEPQPCFGTST